MANVIDYLSILNLSTIIYEKRKAKVKDASIVHAAEVGWFEPINWVRDMKRRHKAPVSGRLIYHGYLIR